jgi:AmiR/NasT family two-component response regulator
MTTKTTRVLVANRPRLLRELILSTISEAGDIEIVGEVQQESELASAVGRTQPDCVIVAVRFPPARIPETQSDRHCRRREQLEVLLVRTPHPFQAN